MFRSMSRQNDTVTTGCVRERIGMRKYSTVGIGRVALPAVGREVPMCWESVRCFSERAVPLSCGAVSRRLTATSDRMNIGYDGPVEVSALAPVPNRAIAGQRGIRLALSIFRLHPVPLSRLWFFRLLEGEPDSKSAGCQTANAIPEVSGHRTGQRLLVEGHNRNRKVKGGPAAL
jgi:hypothetical protein